MLPLGGDGFIAVFVARLAFGNTAGWGGHEQVLFVEGLGALASLLVWLVFGAVAVAPALTGLTWQAVLYAILSLTVVRMLLVAIALLGTVLSGITVGFIGWFGPRGLASVIFAVLTLETLPEAAAGPVVNVITVTALLSFVAYGISAGSLAARYGATLVPTPRCRSGTPYPNWPCAGRRGRAGEPRSPLKGEEPVVATPDAV
ncbi:hypothetical protein C3Y87_12775 [Carbonactinospora thermoautotrophica]|uniref:hypothetical protein n=1 Tax=Carbonactinospora thermoautotrophica TaxID=1469144 RepID=UPI0022712A7D|nr:hypothetical protein [Carbonactinospora thermoautotrophica]MCX9192273.1 hypothetical protein [Carbonactinospora thermoautotrophica]